MYEVRCISEREDGSSVGTDEPMEKMMAYLAKQCVDKVHPPFLNASNPIRESWGVGDGPLLPLTLTSRRSNASHHSGHSLQLQKL